jgi:hypothetical protein
MARPGFIHIDSITCKTTDDLIGRDSLLAVIGPLRVPLGEFHARETRTVGIEKTLTAGSTTMEIYEQDLVDQDDLLASLDLTTDMDVQRLEHFATGDAAYMISFFVASTPD